MTAAEKDHLRTLLKKATSSGDYDHSQLQSQLHVPSTQPSQSVDELNNGNRSGEDDIILEKKDDG